jgi:hypothetical protein
VISGGVASRAPAIVPREVHLMIFLGVFGSFSSQEWRGTVARGIRSCVDDREAAATGRGPGPFVVESAEKDHPMNIAPDCANPARVRNRP